MESALCIDKALVIHNNENLSTIITINHERQLLSLTQTATDRTSVLCLK